MEEDRFFWKQKKLHELTLNEWESLCDRCGKCCLHKIEDEDTGKIFFTYIACNNLCIETCTCTHYYNRFEINPDCTRLHPNEIKGNPGLPDTCAYRLIAEGKDIPWWHPLKTGNPDSTHKSHNSVKHIAIPEKEVDVIENHIIFYI